jgi:hypothetical protein
LGKPVVEPRIHERQRYALETKDKGSMEAWSNRSTGQWQFSSAALAKDPGLL